MRILVTGATGATGVIGKRVVPLLVGAGHQVTAVARSAGKRASLDRQGAKPVTVDLFDPAAVRRTVVGYDAVCNLATAIPAASRLFFRRAWRENDRVRQQVSANLVDAALGDGGVTRFIQESFAPIYAPQDDAWIDERSPVKTGNYNRSALDAEAAAARFTAAGGQRAGIVLRFGAFYGPGDPASLQFLALVRRGWSPIFGHAEGFFSWLSHDDAATAVVAALAAPAGIYNVVDDQPLRRRELVNGLADLLGVAPPKFLPAWTAKLAGSVGEMLARSLRISNRTFKSVARWTPQHPSAIDGFRVVVAELRR